MHAVDHRYSETISTQKKTRTCTECLGTGVTDNSDAELVDCSRCDGIGAVASR